MKRAGPSIDTFLDASLTEFVATWSHVRVFDVREAHRASEMFKNRLHLDRLQPVTCRPNQSRICLTGSESGRSSQGSIVVSRSIDLLSSSNQCPVECPDNAR